MKNLTVTHTGALAVSAPTTPLLQPPCAVAEDAVPSARVVLAACSIRRTPRITAPRLAASSTWTHPSTARLVPALSAPIPRTYSTSLARSSPSAQGWRRASIYHAHVASRRGGGGGDDPSSSDGRGSSDSSSGASAASLSSRSRRSLRVHAARRVVSCGSNASAIE